MICIIPGVTWTMLNKHLKEGFLCLVLGILLLYVVHYQAGATELV